jgi:hypothetical protein
VVFCDVCGAEITDALDGNYQWLLRDEERPAGARADFTHKRCCDAFDQAHAGAMVAAISLECLPIFLGNNLGVD